ncbi:ABC transporter ATP-binding protein [Mesorhizobium sp.]|uniref:ABC transporter ATP-binding protein n=1 Tax=Mesorhizobium sp. TaxID=1871066 RepID=UPI000FE66608|nr:ABC transporter ATP-binding protein [Mesorhizobium sp.]RWP64438.1 MAG: ABC transporter ATP-binding protein [Mesorhizobium sp.]
MSDLSAIEVRDLKVHFQSGSGSAVRAVDGVTFSVAAGAFHGIIGESGCGKTTLARAIIGLQSTSSGSVRIERREREEWQKANRLEFARTVQFVFQDPLGSMSRRQTVRQTLEEPLLIHRHPDPARRIEELLRLVSLPATVLDRLPRSLSGGQRQRVAIARALALEPKILICDEPLSALDVSIRAQIVNLFRRLQSELGLTIVMVAHDLAVIREICTTVTVMYLGQVVEEGRADALFANPTHPYTRALLSAVPSADPRIEEGRRRILLAGDPPSPLSIPSGCRFHTRCPIAEPQCETETPDLRSVGHGGRARCILTDAAHRPKLFA